MLLLLLSYFSWTSIPISKKVSSLFSAEAQQPKKNSIERKISYDREFLLKCSQASSCGKTPANWDSVVLENPDVVKKVRNITVAKNIADWYRYLLWCQMCGDFCLPFSCEQKHAVSWLVTPHVTNWIWTQIATWAPKKKVVRISWNFVRIHGIINQRAPYL